MAWADAAGLDESMREPFGQVIRSMDDAYIEWINANAREK